MFNNELNLTSEQEKRRQSIERRMKRCLRELEELAIEAGAVDPHLFYECAGSLCVFDYERGDPGVGGSAVRQDKVCLSVGLFPGAPALDCGAW
jgi:hypothetical protein